MNGKQTVIYTTCGTIVSKLAILTEIEKYNLIVKIKIGEFIRHIMVKINIKILTWQF